MSRRKLIEKHIAENLFDYFFSGTEEDINTFDQEIEKTVDIQDVLNTFFTLRIFRIEERILLDSGLTHRDLNFNNELLRRVVQNYRNSLFEIQ